MDAQKAFVDGSSAFFIVLAIGIIVLFVEKHEKGEFDWKEFGKWVFYSLLIGLAAFFGSLFHVGGWGKE